MTRERMYLMRTRVRMLVGLIGLVLIVVGFAMFIGKAAAVFGIGAGGLYHGVAFLALLAGGTCVTIFITAQPPRVL